MTPLIAVRVLFCLPLALSLLPYLFIINGWSEGHDVSTSPPTHKFSRVLKVGDMAQGELSAHISAEPAEREVLSQRLGLVSLDRLTVEARFHRLHGGPRVRARVNLIADVVQSCVVTLQPVAARIVDILELDFDPRVATPVEAQESGATGGREVLVGLDDEEKPEPMHDGNIDLGEAVATYLALVLDPYPRTSGVEFSGYGDGEGARETPFAALAGIQGKRKR